MPPASPPPERTWRVSTSTAPPLRRQRRRSPPSTPAAVEPSRWTVADRTRSATLSDVFAARGRLDVMVNVAGIIRNGSVIDTAEADLDAVWAVNFKGVFFGCQAAARPMVEQRSGSIVNMASAAIDDPSPGLVCYATAKAAVAQLTRTLAAEVGPSGVRVNAVAPGFIETPMTARHFTRADGTLDDDRRAAVHAPMIARSPLGMIGQPDDVAEAVAYLACDASRFVTGQVLRINGGVAMPL